MHAQAQPRGHAANELSGSDHPGSPTQDHKPMQRARAARCAVNNTAPGRQPAATVPSRRSSDWRPGPTRLHLNSARPQGRTAAARPRSVYSRRYVRPRELASPAQPPAQGDGGLQHAPVLRESTMALTESVGAQTAWRPGPTRSLACMLTARPQGRTAAARPRYTRR
jgi:hypothetical protein